MATTITVLGDGAWGSAIAHTLATAGHDTTLWCYDKTVAEDISSTHENKKYLSGITLHKTLKVTTELNNALAADIIFVAIPVTFLHTTLLHCAPHARKDQTWIMLSKGIEQTTLALASDILIATINPTHWCVLSGPTYARDLALKQPTGFTLAAHPEPVEEFTANPSKKIPPIFPDYCIFDYSHDTIGVQLYGALKNILALGIGALEGAGYTDNAQALFFTRVFNEMTTLVTTLGGAKESAFSLAALGDSLLTGYGKQSKNKKLGLLLGAGKTLQEALQAFPTAPESVNTLESTQQLVHKHALQTPCIQTLYAYIHGTKTITEIITTLLSRN